jgi:hypothetical protein
VIGIRLGREDHGSIPTTAIEKELEPFDLINDPQTRLGGPVDRILVVKTRKIKSSLKLEGELDNAASIVIVKTSKNF